MMTTLRAAPSWRAFRTSGLVGKEEQATVEAFKLGKCHRKLMYKAVEWYFPQHGQGFSASHYENICKGTYVSSP